MRSRSISSRARRTAGPRQVERDIWIIRPVLRSQDFPTVPQTSTRQYSTAVPALTILPSRMMPSIRRYHTGHRPTPACGMSGKDKTTGQEWRPSHCLSNSSPWTPLFKHAIFFEQREETGSGNLGQPAASKSECGASTKVHALLRQEIRAGAEMCCAVDGGRKQRGKF